MKKISTLFKKDPTNLGIVINEINPENKWVFDEPENVIPTQKLDGTACAIINGELYKRYDVKKGKQVPENAIPCQDPDEITGHWPHWVKCDRNNPNDKWFFEAFDIIVNPKDGTYELVGPKVQGNVEKYLVHMLVEHGYIRLINTDNWYSFDGIKTSLERMDIEGIVFHHKTDGRMCKIRKKDFGLKREDIKIGMTI